MRICLQAVVVDRIRARIRTSLPVPADSICLSSALKFQEPVAQPCLRILLPSYTRRFRCVQTRPGETLILPRSTCFDLLWQFEVMVQQCKIDTVLSVP